MKVKLAEGRALRDPVTKVLIQPDEVRDVPLNQYWRRRLRDGDVVRAEREPEEQRGDDPVGEQPQPVERREERPRERRGDEEKGA